MWTSRASPDLTVLYRIEAVRVPSRPGTSETDIARVRPLLDLGASAIGSEEGETRALSFRTVPWLPASSYDPMSIVRAP